MSNKSKSAEPRSSYIDRSQIFLSIYVPSFCCRNFQWETCPPDKVDIIVENTAQVDKVMRIDRLHSVTDLFLFKTKTEHKV
jgi:hypothetical protein